MVGPLMAWPLYWLLWIPGLAASYIGLGSYRYCCAFSNVRFTHLMEVSRFSLNRSVSFCRHGNSNQSLGRNLGSDAIVWVALEVGSDGHFVQTYMLWWFRSLN